MALVTDMTMSNEDLAKLRDRAIETVRHHALAKLQSPVSDIRSKTAGGDGTPDYDIVTATDIAIQEVLKAPLEALLAGSEMVGEEDFAGLPDPAARPYWILDPVDGTLNFANGMPGFGLSLALLIGGRSVLGIVVDGVTGRVYDAILAGGARLDGQPIRRDATLDGDARAPICLSSGVFSLIASKNPSALAELLAINSRIRLIGGQALQLCWVATGALSLNVNREAKLWDDAAGALIVQEAGGHYQRLSGDALFPLEPGDPALVGQSLFSLAGSPETVARAQAILERLAD